MRLLHRRPYLRPPAIPRQGATYEDQAPFLNSLIEDAYESEAGIFTLPMGELTLGSPLYIKKGWENFILQGHPGGTVLKALPDFVAAPDDCLIGIAINGGNDVNDLWDITASGRRTTAGLRAGDTTIELLPGQSEISSPTFWGLADQDTIPEWDDSLDVWERITYRAELVEVVDYNHDLRRAVLSRPVSRDYDQSVQLLPLGWNEVGVRMCKNITVRNLTLDGLQNVVTPIYLPFGIYGALCWGLQIQNIQTRYFRDSHLRLDACSNLGLSGVECFGEHEFSDLLRGLNFFYCRDIYVSNISADKLRHGVQFSQGNSYFTLDGYVATDSYDASLDTHGARNQHGTLRNFQIDESCKVGNTSYPAGDQDITLLNGAVGKALTIQGGSQASVTSVTAQYLLLQTIARFPQFYPHDCTYTNCTFDHDISAFGTNALTTNCHSNAVTDNAFRRSTNQHFYGCTFSQAQVGASQWCIYFEAIDNPSEFRFFDCTFVSFAFNPLIDYLNGDTAPVWRLNLTVDSCHFVSEDDYPNAIEFQANTRAGIRLSNSSFVTGDPTPNFLTMGSGSLISIDEDVDNVINP
ncbi:MAG: hypothetical protein HONBIEJF_01635 [Fimbriimonadaceae bacterium]|nr:hypothetical protein [Fimbriimonadaceae bacterium]